MIDLQPLKRIFIASAILAPFGAWKAAELIIWAFSHVDLK